MHADCMKDRHITTTSDTPIAPLTSAALPSAVTHQPAFIRLPPAGASCPWTGLRRSKLNELVLPSALNGFAPPVKSVRIVNKGQTKKAVRLIVFKSLVDYLHGLER